MSKEQQFLNVLASFAGPYRPMASLADSLVRAKVIEIHRPYKGKNPRNPRYKAAASAA